MKFSLLSVLLSLVPSTINFGLFRPSLKVSDKTEKKERNNNWPLLDLMVEFGEDLCGNFEFGSVSAMSTVVCCVWWYQGVLILSEILNRLIQNYLFQFPNT